MPRKKAGFASVFAGIIVVILLIKFFPPFFMWILTNVLGKSM